MTVRVAVLITTMKRPRLLRQLLSALDSLAFTGDPPQLQIVVTDNDPDRSAEPICEELRTSLRWPLRYVSEPRRGIPFARNAAVRAAVGDHDFVAFIDDDEVPTRQWLDELLKLQQRLDADVVAGPVESVMPADSPRWATAGKVFEHTRYQTGSSIDACATNNVLIRCASLQQMDSWFDERMALTGGSDRHFFLRMNGDGRRMVWCDEALVTEEVPESRVKIRWVVARMYRQGINRGFCDIDLERSAFPRLRAAVLGTAYIGGGLGLLPVGAVTGSHRLVQYARYAAYGVGLLQSCRGKFYQEYRDLHGS